MIRRKEPKLPASTLPKAGRRRNGRRRFLIGSAVVAGGVAFGAYRLLGERPNPLLEGLADGEAAITPYVKIDGERITLITPRADKGQGAYAVQALLIAEELDVDPMKVQVDPGLPSAVYYNGALLDEGVPFPAYDDGWIAGKARGMMTLPARALGLQVTGGSSTTRDAFVRLRQAGAVARETIKEAAARRVGIPRDRLQTEDGHVLLPDGQKIAYTALAREAAGIEPITDVPLRPASSWRLIGRDRPRLDMVRKCTGTETYGIDVRFDDMLYAAVRANPGIGSPVKRFDAARAKTMRGVHKVVPITNGVGVLADNTWRAMQAVQAIDIDWEPGPYPATQSEIWQRLADCLHDDYRDSRRRDDGDIEAALSDPSVLSAEYRVPYLAHAPLEPMNAVARVTADRCEIWTGTQIPRIVQQHAAKLLDLSVDQVTVHALPCGGSFGARLEDTCVLQAVELARQAGGRPVKLTWSREEDMTHDYPRPAQLARARGSFKDGQVDAFDLSIASTSVMESWVGRLVGKLPGPDVTIVAGAWDQPYAIPNYRVSGYRAPPMVPVSSWRSVGASGNAFFHESFLDELIAAAGADPLQERLRLCEDPLSRKVLEAVGAMANWQGPRPGPNQGRGVAFCLSFGVPVAEIVDVTMTEAGIRIDQVFVAAEVGRVIDPRNFENQIVGGVLWGLGHAIHSELTYRDHAPEQSNFDTYPSLRLNQAPRVVMRAITNGSQLRGIGEPPVPPAAPALANAIFAATGQRIRELPLRKHIAFA